MDRRFETGRTVGLVLLVLVVSLPFTATAHASENDWQEWTTFRINVPMPSSRWSFGVWNQARFNDDIGRFNWLLINPSLHYKLSKHWKVGFGMQYIVKNSADDETMPWQEISLSHKFGNHLVLAIGSVWRSASSRTPRGWCSVRATGSMCPTRYATRAST